METLLCSSRADVAVGALEFMSYGDNLESILQPYIILFQY